MKRSKNYKKAVAKVSAQKYTLEETLTKLPEVSISKFPGSVEVEFILKLTEKQKNESIRGSYTLPHSFGKATRVLAFVDPANKNAGKKADIVGGEELIEKVEKGELEFDIVITTPAMMPKIAKLGKTLGTKGLMPNPKNGTITNDIDAAVEKFKAGARNFKIKDGAKITGVIGKTDMGKDKLADNFKELHTAIIQETKKLGNNVISSVRIKPTMGPLLNVDLNSIS